VTNSILFDEFNKNFCSSKCQFLYSDNEIIKEKQHECRLYNFRLLSENDKMTKFYRCHACKEFSPGFIYTHS
jgi:DNA-directed RNA polymerase subunit M/transcription elongation factor TFIIS